MHNRTADFQLVDTLKTIKEKKTSGHSIAAFHLSYQFHIKTNL